jgi:anti-sigma B factor antagonist
MANLSFKAEKFALPNNSYCAISRVKGRIDAATIVPFEQHLSQFLAEGTNQLIINLSELNYISSSGMGLLIKYVEKYRDAGGDIQIACIPPSIWAIFKLIGLGSALEMFDSEKDALGNITEKANYKPITKQHYPAKFKCPSCEGILEIAHPGKYRCVHCSTYFSAEETGAVKAFMSKVPKILEARLSTNTDNSEWIKSTIENQALLLNFNGEDISKINAAVMTVCSLINNTGKSISNYRLVIISEKQKLIIGFVIYDTILFSAEMLNRPEYQKIKSNIDKIDLNTLAPKGQLIRLTKELPA